MNANAASIHSHLGNDKLGLLYLTVKPEVYNTLPPSLPQPMQSLVRLWHSLLSYKTRWKDLKRAKIKPKKRPKPPIMTNIAGLMVHNVDIQVLYTLDVRKGIKKIPPQKIGWEDANRNGVLQRKMTKM